MPGFRRVFTQNPGLNVLGNIESVNTIDIAPPAAPLGAGVGVVCVVGEFEKGLFNAPRRIFGNSDIEANFGGFGYTEDGSDYVYPVAVRSGGSNNSNYWNGNGYLALATRTFAGLILVRVDNSPGTVSFSRLACLTGGAGTYDMEPGQDLILKVDGVTVGTAVFNAAVGTITGTAGTYPTGFIGGETLELSIDGGPTQVVIFDAADQTLAQVVDRINSATASNIARDDGGQLALDSRIVGWGGSIEVVGGSAVAVLGLPATAVQQIDVATVNNNTGGGTFTLRLNRSINGSSVDYDASYLAAPADTPTIVRDGLLNALQALAVPGLDFSAQGIDQIGAKAEKNILFTFSVIAEPAAGDVTIANLTPPVLTKAQGTGNVQNIDTVRRSEAIAIINLVPGVVADTSPAGKLRICATTTPATGTLEIDPASTAALPLELPTGLVAQAANATASKIPAGTVLRDTVNGGLWVTIEDVDVTAIGGGPYDIKVRPAIDDDTTPTASAGNLTELVSTLADGFAISNADDLSRLTPEQMDVRYLEAIDATIDISGIPYDINIMFSARTSERIMLKLRENALEATASGHRARKAVVSPLLATSREEAKSSIEEGVGNVGREQRVGYVFPGFSAYIPEIASKGTTGGPGFTEDGVIGLRGEGYYAAVRSIIPPEENAGQELSSTNYGPLNVVSLEDAYNKEQGGIGLTIEDYIDFKANGIIAPIAQRGSGVSFQSDVTSVNPAIQPALTDQKRRYMGDFIIDSLGDIAEGYVKKLNTPARRRALLAVINGFLTQLQDPNAPESSRIEGYDVKDETSPELRAQGFQIIDVKVRLYASMDYIVYRTSVGTTVDVQEI